MPIVVSQYLRSLVELNVLTGIQASPSTFTAIFMNSGRILIFFAQNPIARKYSPPSANAA
jgi:hypothetical protein